ncbi:PKD domain-containing protein [bacterium]|nr:PKD domain-containing protein [bacterium]
MKKFIHILFFLFVGLSAMGQIDREFWFAVPEAAQGHGDRPVFLRISTFDKKAEVLVDVPANKSFKPKKFSVKAYSTYSLELTDYLGLLECIDYNTVKQNGLRIRANNYIAVYYDIDNHLNREIFTLKGKNALGTKFLTPFQNVYPNGNYQPLTISSIDVVATEDNTEVTLVPTKMVRGTGYSKVTVKLDKGETYSFQAASKAAANHLSGSVVTSTKPIAITMKDDSVDPSPCLDMVGDQIVPVDILGTEHLVVKGQLTYVKEYFFVTAPYDNTKVETNGGGTYTLKSGDNLAVEMKNDEYFVKSSKPVYIYHMSGFGCETGGAIIPPLNCTGAKRVSFARTSTEDVYLNIVVPAGKEKYFKVNGKSIWSASSFKSVSGTSKWKVAQFSINIGDVPANSIGLVTNDSARFQLGVINGSPRNGCKYGYFSPFSSLNLGDNVNLCFGERVVLDAGYGFDTILWSTQSSAQRILVTKPGAYSVRVATQNGCVLFDTVVVTVSPKPLIEVNDSVQCLNDNLFHSTVKNPISTSSYSWRLDNKIYKSNSNLHQFSTYGYKTIWLKSETDEGCIDSSSRTVQVLKNPVAHIDFGQKTGCTNEPHEFFDGFLASSAGIDFSWTFGDGKSSTKTRPKHRFRQKGSYNIALKLSDTFGCSDTFTYMRFKVVDGNKSSFSLNDTQQCKKGNLFEMKGSNNGASYHWDFGDNTGDKANSTAKTYNKPGTYTVIFSLTDKDGCHDSSTQTVYVLESPKAAIGVNDSMQCPYENDFIFSSKSSFSTGNPDNYWNLGDGFTSRADSVRHSYDVGKTDSLCISLVSTAANGCKDSSSMKIVLLPLPQANFLVDTTEKCLSANLFKFNNLSKVSRGKLTYEWLFGDGQSSAVVDPIHSYKTADTFTVALVAKAACLDTFAKQMVVHPQPTAQFSTNDTVQCFQNNRFVARNQSIISSGTLGYSWRINNQEESNSLDYKKSFAKTGNYWLKLIAKSDKNCYDSAGILLRILPEPKSNFRVNEKSQCFNENYYVFKSQCSLDSGAFYTIWDFGNGNRSLQAYDSFSFGKEGLYTVVLTTVSYEGCADSAIKTMQVLPSPKAAFTSNKTAECISANQFEFSATSRISQGSFNYLWLFGDGSSSTLQQPKHSYSTADTFDVILINTSDSGCTDTTSQNILVWDRPSVKFYINDSTQCLEKNLMILYNNSSTIQDTLYYQWHLGDGSKSNAKTLSHSYSSAGRYAVKLIAATNTGCIDSLEKHITIYDQPAPVAGFSVASDSAQCLKGNYFEIKNLSHLKKGKLHLVWKPDDGRVVADSVLRLSYQYADTFSFRLIAVSDFGCKDSTEKLLYVWPQNDLKNSFDYPLCQGDSFTIINNSKLQWGTAQYHVFIDDSIRTDFGNGNVINKSGFHDLSIFSTTNYGCSDTLTDSFFVNALPVAQYKWDVHYYNSATLKPLNKSNGNRYAIDWRDGKTDSSETYLHHYQSSGPYEPILYTTSDSGCQSVDTLLLKFHADMPRMRTVSRPADTAQKGLEVSWYHDNRAMKYAVLRKQPGDTQFVVIDSNIVPARPFKFFTYTDAAANNDTLIYAYEIRGTDSLQKISKPSATAKNIVLRKVRQEGNEITNLEWTAYGYNWPKVDSYAVFGYTGSGSLLLAYTKGGTLQYRDSISAENNGCYRIAALGKDSSLSLSNVLCNNFHLWMPNAFSPNGDGLNDQFKFVANKIYDFEIQIFARNGQRVFYSNNPMVYWDGKVKGETVQMDRFFWIIRGKSEKSLEENDLLYSGNVQVIR